MRMLLAYSPGMKFVLGLLFAFLVSPSFAQSRPNIVWMFADDHAWQAVGAYGGRLKKENLTPNIDRIAREGMVFDRAYVGNSICAPSRATLLTGKHSHLNGKRTNGGSFNHDQQQFQKILRKSGYQTAMVGKIHLSGKMQGFDYWEVLPGQGSYNNPRFVTEEGTTQYKGHSSDIITERALNWMDNGRAEDKPFMLMVHYKAPHRNWTPAPRFVEPFSKRTFDEPGNLFDDYKNRQPPAANQAMTIARHMRPDGDLKINRREDRGQWMSEKIERSPEERTRQFYQWYMQDYLACIAGIDENVGKILAYLEKKGLVENTVVMYCSDQGFYLGEHGWYDKRWMYEESYRTPLVARWPGVVKPGSRNDDLVQNIDFAETFLDIAGAEIPEDMQGHSLVPLLKGNTPSDWRTSLYYHYYEGGGHGVAKHEGVSDKRYKLIRFYGKGDDKFELFDLETDPTEMKSVYGQPDYAEVQKRLHAELGTLREHYGVKD